jgi:hypothetical protein
VYTKGCGITESAEDFNKISRNIEGSEVIIYVGGLSRLEEGEGQDRNDIDIPTVQRQLIQNLKTLSFIYLFFYLFFIFYFIYYHLILFNFIYLFFIFYLLFLFFFEKFQ